jgi:DNA-binding MarR family transcriptional regulator
VNDVPAFAGTPPTHPLGRRLAFTGGILRDLTNATLARYGADLNTWIVLNQAAQHGGGLAFSQRQLAEGLHMSGPALVRHLDRLEHDDLVRRQRDEHDRRVTRITITAKGRRLLGRLRGVMADHDARVRGCLTPTEVRTLERALDKLYTYASEALGAPDEREHTT